MRKQKNNKVFRNRGVWVLTLLVAFLFSTPASADFMQSASFRVTGDVISIGGGAAASGSFTVEDAIGEAATAEDLGSGSFLGCVGFECFLAMLAPSGRPPSDTIPPTIINCRAENIGQFQADIKWNTDETATSLIRYGLTPAYGQTAADPSLLLVHSMTASPLVEGTQYHFQCCSTDQSGNQGCGGDNVFTTLDLTPPVTTPPVISISDVRVTGLTMTGAVIGWLTDEAADSKVDYGLTDAYGSTVTDGALVASHSIAVPGLTPGTLYHYRVRSADGSGNSASSGDYAFTTLSTPDTTPPVISAVQATNITHNAATIIWTTDEGANSTVEYGLMASYGSTASNPAMVTSHSVPLSGLLAQMTYHYQVKSADGSGNSTISGDYTFTTTLPLTPVISNIRVRNVTQSTASVLWDTDTASDSRVDYGLTTGYGSTASSAPRVTSSHIINLFGLQQGMTYNYKITSVDQYGQTTTTANRTFATLADTTPPANVTSLVVAPGDNRNDLSWTNPVDPDLQGVTITRKTSGYPTGPTDGTVIYTGAGTSYSDIGLTSGVTYYYAVFAYDEVPNYASGVVVTGTPTGPADTTAPGDVTGFTATAGNGRIDLAWTDPSDPDLAGVVIYRKGGSCPAGRNDGTMVYIGTGTSLIDAGLTNGTLYCYRAFAFDNVPNYSPGMNAQATPTGPADTTAPEPVSHFVVSAGDTEVQLAWINPIDPDWAGTRIVRKTGGYPASPTDGFVAFDGRGDSRLDVGLTNDTTYYYAAFAYDAAGNFAAPATAQATPRAGAIPRPPTCTDSDGGRQYGIFGTVTDADGTYDDACSSGTAVRENFCDAGGNGVSEIHDCDAGFKCTGGRCVPETYQPTMAVCGNGQCEETENSLNCPLDCPVVPVQEPVGPEGTDLHRLTPLDLIYLATSGELPLQLDSGGRLWTYPSMAVVVVLPDVNIRQPISSAFINLGDSTYIMTPRNSVAAKIITPSHTGESMMTVVINYTDGTSDTVDVVLHVIQRIYVVTSEGGSETSLGGARVTLWRDSGGGSFNVWNGSPYGEGNPALTDGSGLAGFIVPPGSYKLSVDMDGYTSRETFAFPITYENVVSQEIKLVKAAPPLADTIADILSSDASAGEKAAATAKAIAGSAAATAAAAASLIGEAAQNPYVEQAATNVAAPAATAMAAANIIALGMTTAGGIPYLMYLLSLLAHPILLFGRRKRKEWGIVYDALTKRPIDLVIVRLIDARTQRVLRSAVTDKDGRFFFVVQAGEYKLTAVKSGFAFPTAFLKDKKEDGAYLDLYHGEVIRFRDSGAIAVNIPLDATVAEKTGWQIKAVGFGRKLQHSVGIISILAMAAAAAIKPTPFMLGLTAANLVIYLALRRLSVARRPKNWGVVYDDATGKPIRNALARVFEARFNKLLETQVTDSRGRYSFLVGKNVYFVTFEKPGYQKEQKGPIDLLAARAGKQHEGLVTLDIRLKPADKIGKGSLDKAKTPPSAPSIPSGTVPFGVKRDSPQTAPLAPPAKLSSKISTPAISPTQPETVVNKPISWEVKLALKLAKKAPTETAPKIASEALSIPPAALPLPIAPKPMPSGVVSPAAGLAVPRTPLIQDAEHAHPEEFKTIKAIEEPDSDNLGKKGKGGTRSKVRKSDQKR